MKPYRVRKVEPMNHPNIANQTLVQPVVFRADPHDVTLEFPRDVLAGFREILLDATELIPDTKEDAAFEKELTGTRFGKQLYALEARDRVLLRRALARLSERGKSAFLQAIRH